MARTKRGAKKAPREARAAQPQKGKRFSPEQRQHALVLVASGMKRTEIAKVIGTTTESIRRWVNAAEASGTMPAPPSEPESAEVVEEEATASESTSGAPSPYVPKDPGQGLADYEVDAILKYKKRHPSMGPKQIRAQLKRFKGWRLSIKAIARVLKAHGYELVHKGSRPQGPEPTRFEAPRRNALWQIDYADLRVGPDRMHLLVVLDDFSRFVVGHGLFDSPSGAGAIETLRLAIARHGKPEAIRTDRGGGFLSGEFTDFLEAELIEHVVGRSYHPQGGGKVESLIGTIRRELWDVVEFPTCEEASRRLSAFLDAYNESRAHMGIDGLTPADRYHGRADRVLAAINAVSRGRQAALARQTLDGALEEVLPSQSGAPFEVLRLVIVDGEAELRFCGARVRLGKVES